MDDVNEAVKIIKEYCASFDDCGFECRFYKKWVGCMLFDVTTPEEWEVLD